MRKPYERALRPPQWQDLPYYTCQRAGIEQAKPICQSVPGAGIDRAIGELVVETLAPLTLEVTLAVHQELQARFEEADRLRHKAVERAQYEADLARRRYMRVEPENRLVADSLEAEWNEKLRAVAEAQEHYLNAEEIAAKLGIAVATVKDWRYKGWLEAVAYDDKPRYL